MLKNKFKVEMIVECRPSLIEHLLEEICASGNGYFNVALEEPAGHTALCRASGRLITRKIQLLVGDKVTVELSEYDLGRGRITLRDK
jgi:translation initiation factor IF-1